MKKIALLLTVIIFAISIFACKEAGKIADTVTEEKTDVSQTELQTDAQTEPQTEQQTEPVTEDPEKLAVDFIETVNKKMADLDDYSVKTTTTMTAQMTVAGIQQNNETVTVSEYRIKNAKSVDRITELHQTVTDPSIGSQTSMDLYMNKDEVFVRTDPETRFTVMSSEDENAAQYYQSYGQKEGSNDIDEVSIINPTVTDNPDGTKTVSYTVANDSLSDIVQRSVNEFKESFSAIGATDINVTIESVNMKYTVSAEGYITVSDNEMTFSLTMKVNNVDVTATIVTNEKAEFGNIGQPVEIVFPERPAPVYELYIPFFGSYDYSAELILENNGIYERNYSVTDEDYGFSVTTVKTESGTYVYNEDKTRVTCSTASVVLKMLFENDADKSSFKAMVDTALKSETIDEKIYRIILQAIEKDGYSATGEELKDLEKIKNGFGYDDRFGSGDIILEPETMKAYTTVADIILRENEYYLAYEDMFLMLDPDGTCSMYGEYTSSTEGFGKFTESYIYKGKYEKNELSVTCTFTSYNEKLSFSSSEALKEYKRMYKEQYDSGYLGKFYYDYYMALVSTEGYTEDGEDVYKILLEPHTHTASITEAPDYES